MPSKLSTTVNHIQSLSNTENAVILFKFLEFMKNHDASERHQNNNLKSIVSYSKFLGTSSLKEITVKEDILSFLQTKIKSKEDDPDKKWITTYNDYLHRIRHFFRWLYNEYGKQDEENIIPMEFWKNPHFINMLKPKKTKRLSPYSETEIWDRGDLQTIIKYEHYKRNKAVLALLWDLDARPHEVTSLQIKHIRLKETYGEGEIPHHTKTGGSPILLTFSFLYVRDWLNEHPFKNEPQARLIVNLLTGAPIRSDQINEIMKQLKRRIARLLENNEIRDLQERGRLEYLLKTKKWNPYCIRHSSITADSDYLPDYALKKKVRWSMNSKQGTRYIKKRMGNELKNKILEYNGISDEKSKMYKPSVSYCPRCTFVNTLENRYCSACSYPLSLEAYDQIKQEEEKRFIAMEKKYTDKLTNIDYMLDKLFIKVDMQKVT